MTCSTWGILGSICQYPTTTNTNTTLRGYLLWVNECENRCTIVSKNLIRVTLSPSRPHESLHASKTQQMPAVTEEVQILNSQRMAICTPFFLSLLGDNPQSDGLVVWLSLNTL